MSDYIYLQGSEDVRAGGHAAERGGDAMRSAADTMAEALRAHTSALYDHQIFLRDWLEQYVKDVQCGSTHTIFSPSPGPDYVWVNRDEKGQGSSHGITGVWHWAKRSECRWLDGQKEASS